MPGKELLLLLCRRPFHPVKPGFPDGEYTRVGGCQFQLRQIDVTVAVPWMYADGVIAARARRYGLGAGIDDSPVAGRGMMCMYVYDFH